MLKLTEAAGEHLLHWLQDVKAPQHYVARCVADFEGLVLRLDRPRPGDKQLEYDGHIVLVMDDRVSEVLDQRTLALARTKRGFELRIR